MNIPFPKRITDKGNDYAHTIYILIRKTGWTVEYVMDMSLPAFFVIIRELEHELSEEEKAIKRAKRKK